MRLPHARFTVRHMMVVVAIVAILIWGTSKGRELWKRAGEYRERAGIYAAMQRWAEEEASRKEDRIKLWADRPEEPRQERWARELSRAREQAAYFSALSRKYSRLASRPWEPNNNPDPPPVAGYPTPPPPD